MIKEQNNYAFIDSQNLNLGIQELGWKLDFKKFRVYLREKYGVNVAYIFIGYVAENQSLYNSLQKQGFVLVFKPTIMRGDGSPKGNCDAELVLHTMIEYPNYDKAIIVSGNGDFHCLVEYLYKKNKLQYVMAPNKKKCSILLMRAAKEKIVFMDNLKRRLEYKYTKGKSTA